MANLNSTSARRPVVTIGLPVFNGERYLPNALDSLLAQQGCDIRLIISDNNSTDRTRQICDEYVARDSRILYHRNEQNIGAAQNYNLVLALAETEYFKWAPYDDLIAPDYVARCVEVLERDPSVILCYTRVNIIDEHGAFDVIHNPGPESNSTLPQQKFRNFVLRPEYALQQMGVVRTSVLRSTVLHGPYPSSDEILLADLAMKGLFHELPERLYSFRRHKAQSTGIAKQRDRIFFYDPSLAGKPILPTWRYLAGGLNVVRRSTLRKSARLSGYLTMLLWSLRPDHLRALGKDLLLVAAHYFSRPKRSPVVAKQRTSTAKA